MSSPESDEAPSNNIFLPSMLRKNGKFGASLGNALMNKFKPPAKSPSTDEDKPLEESSAPEATNAKFGSRENLAQRIKTPESRPFTYNFTKDALPVQPKDLKKSNSMNSESLESSTSADNTNTLDRVGRTEILKDVRSQRVRPPSTRPKSAQILKEQLIAAEIPLDDDSSDSTPPETPEVPKVIDSPAKTVEDKAVHKLVSAQAHAEAIRRQYPLRSRAERPLSVGNLESVRRTSESPKEDKIDEVDKAKGRNKVLAKGLYHSKSTELLSSDFAASKESISNEETKNVTQLSVSAPSTENVEKANPVDKFAIRSLKTLAVTLQANIKNMEAEIRNMKTQLTNLVTLIGEIEREDKK